MRWLPRGPGVLKMRSAVVAAGLAVALLAGVLLIAQRSSRAGSMKQQVDEMAASRPRVLLSRKKLRRGPVNVVRKVAIRVTSLPASHRAREMQLSSQDRPQLTAVEQARCVGMLHACQSWLELKDGQQNSIVITSPSDSSKELLNKDLVLPDSGGAIPEETWSVMVKACKYGLSDLSMCDKPDHWPRCTGETCTHSTGKDKGAREEKQEKQQQQQQHEKGQSKSSSPQSRRS
mmetsp:Transcript_24399/g.79691  ORF Transcript_24399/g.79691 Transcript_24399/m.79691 type:complete len:232 (-) Transcript_24399:1054-1749(-)